MKIRYTIIFLLLFSCLHFNFAVAQSREAFIEIDSLIQTAEKFRDENLYEEAYKTSLKAIEKSKKIESSESLSKAYLIAAISLFPINRLDESTRLLLLAKNEKYAQTDPELMSRIYFSLALNVHASGLYEEAIKYYRISTNYAQDIEDEHIRSGKIGTNYLNIGDLYQQKEIYDSAIYYYHKSYNLAKEPSNRLLSSVSIVDVYVIENQLDSARKYLEISDSHAAETNSSTYLSIFKKIKGNYNFASGKYKEAIANYKESEKLWQQANRSNSDVDRYLAKAFNELGNKDSADYYANKYLNSREADDRVNKFVKINNSKVPLIISSEEKKNLKQNHQLMTISIVVGSLLIISFTVFLILKQKKKIHKKSIETKTLKKQLNNAFDEVIELAKTNSPNFLPRFIEVYPDFHAKLLEIHPELTHTDLLMAAYLKLNFSTKETAEYTFSSIRTIQNRRYRLRKKLNLDQETDIFLWIKNL